MIFKVDISGIGNGVGASAYGDSLKAYSFCDISQSEWINEFSSIVNYAVNNNIYLPVIRIADGELRLLFPLILLEKPTTFKTIVKNIKLVLSYCGLLGFRTSWGEYYGPSKLLKFRLAYQRILRNFANRGVLSIYWNENGLNAFTTHNKRLLNFLENINITLDKNNYYPFHFPLALLLNDNSSFSINGLNLLFVCSVDSFEKKNIISYALSKGASSVNFYDIPSTSAYKSICSPGKHYDLIFVSAGIASISIIHQFRHMRCPCIDIGGIIHLIGNKKSGYHGDFFLNPHIRSNK